VRTGPYESNGMLPGAEALAGALGDKVDYALVDRMNCKHATWVDRKHGLQENLTDEYFYRAPGNSPSHSVDYVLVVMLCRNRSKKEKPRPVREELEGRGSCNVRYEEGGLYQVV
jgi:hypothetical protein